MSITVVGVGSARGTRIGYIDVEVPGEVLGLDDQQIDQPWAEPTWAHAGQVRAGAAAWVIESEGARIVVDPLQAADEILRSGADAAVHQEAFAARLADAGFARDTITHAVATHLDGIGMLGWRDDDGGWSPFFPNASILMSRRELDALDQGFEILGGPPMGADALAELRAAGAVEATADREAVTGEVTLELTGGHNPGHQVVRIESAGERAVMLGHLALSPLHLAAGPSPLHMDPAAAHSAMTAIRDEDVLLIGPLWPTPGAGRWIDGALTPIPAD